MIETELSGSLREAVDEVLETMFFVESEGASLEDRPPEELIEARVEFEGKPSGALVLRITRRAADQLAADFLGEEAADLAAGRTMEVVTELANMICGALLSRVESDATFRLSPPSASLEAGVVSEPSGGGIAYQVKLPEGALRVRFEVTG